jgi:ATP-dependent protease ClpP protease subunit
MKSKRPATEPTPLTVRPYPTVDAQPLRGDAQPREWELVLCGDLGDKQVELTERLAEVPRRSRGTIYFDSCGGNVFVGLALATLIRLRGLDPLAVVAGECSSAALLPFAACRRRLVTPHAAMLFHPMRWHTEENVKLEEAAEWARQFQLLEGDMDQLLARMFDVPMEKIHEWSRPGRFISGPELAAAGLAGLVDLFSGDVWSQLQGLQK